MLKNKYFVAFPLTLILFLFCSGSIYLTLAQGGVGTLPGANLVSGCTGTCAPAGNCGAGQSQEHNCKCRKNGSQGCVCKGGYICYDSQKVNVGSGGCAGSDCSEDQDSADGEAGAAQYGDMDSTCDPIQLTNSALK